MEDFPRSRRLIWVRSRVQMSLDWDGPRLVLYLLFVLYIADDGVFPFFSAKVIAVYINDNPLPSEELRDRCHIMDIGDGNFYYVETRPVSRSIPTCALWPK